MFSVRLNIYEYSYKNEDSERYDILLANHTRFTFSNISELQKDIQFFKILKENSSIFKEEYLKNLYQKELSRCWTSTEELYSELKIRKKALSLSSEENVANEIIFKLANSNRKFNSFKKFKFEVAFRINVVTLMNDDSIHDRDKFRYPTSEKNYLQLNEKFWEQPDLTSGFFQLRQGFKPSEAINSIFDKTQLVVLECHSMMLSIQYKALLNTIGEKNFDLLFKDTLFVIADKNNLCGQYENDLNSIISKKNSEIKDLIPGDWLYLNNFPNYSFASLYDLSKDGAGLHSLVMEGGKYRGFGLSKSMSETEIKQFFLDNYNKDFRADPIPLSIDSVDEETMGLECPENDLTINQEVKIYGHIDCPQLAWKEVTCIYKGQGRFDCDALEMTDVSENTIVLALLEKFNSILPKRKIQNDLETLNIYLLIPNNVRTISFTSDKFNFLFDKTYTNPELSIFQKSPALPSPPLAANADANIILNKSLYT